MCRNLKSAGFETFWEVLQYYPKDYDIYQPYLQSGAFVQLQGTISKSGMGGPYLQLQIQVDPIHNPLLNPTELVATLASPEVTDLDIKSGSEPDEEGLFSRWDDDDDGDDDESLDDGLYSVSVDLSTISELDEHGRSVLPEEASTSGPLLPHSSASLQPGTRLGNSSSEQQSGQQILEVKQFFGGRFGRYGALKIAQANPAGARVMVHCKVSPGSAPGKKFGLNSSCHFALMLLMQTIHCTCFVIRKCVQFERVAADSGYALHFVS